MGMRMSQILKKGLLAIIMVVFFGASPAVLMALQDDSGNNSNEVHAMKITELQNLFYKVEIEKELKVEFENMHLEEALAQIAREVGLKLTYRGDIMVDKEISLQSESISVSKALESVLENTGLDYKISRDGYLLIAEKNEELEVDLLQTTVTGQVTDSQGGAPLPGVNVVVEGTATGTVTDLEGRYELNIPSDDVVLVFSFIGYEVAQEPVNGRTQIDVILQQDVQLFEDIIVIGYGSVERGDVTGAISSISPRALEDNPNITDAGEALLGRASGVDVTPSGNRPGDGVNILIRGKRSFEAGNDPLFVIDGIPIEDGLNEINPKDIQSMTVLKDASATAIYGSRGANGVIIIETRRGTPGDLRVRVDNQIGVNTVRNRPKLYDAQGWWDYRTEAWNANDVFSESTIFEQQFRDNMEAGNEWDWLDLILQDGLTQEHNISVSGGSEATRFNASVGYREDEAITPLQDYQRFSARLNLDQVISDRFRFGVSLLNSHSIRNGESYNPYGNLFGGIPNGAYNEPPLASPYDEEGNLKFRTSQEPDAINPLADMVDGKYVERREITRVLGSFYIEFDPLENLSLRTNFGPDIRINRLQNFRGRFTTAAVEGDPRGNQTRSMGLGLTWENLINYNMTIAQNHRIDFTGLFSLQMNRNDHVFAAGEGIPIELFQMHNLGAAARMTGINSSYSERTLMSYMGRVNYNYDGRYLLTLNARADGSSKFAEGNRWGFFPSAAVAWNITNEDFMSDNELFSNLALRVSYGETGNEGIQPFLTESVLARTGYNWGGDAAAFGFRPTRMDNPDLRWESTATFNAGVDIEILEGRIGGSFEVYRSKTTDLLLLRELPWTSGFGSIMTNVGVKTNHGVEFSVSTFNIVPDSPRGFSWTTDFNIFTNTERIVELAQGKVDDIGNRRFIGEPADVFYDFERIGIWQVGQEEEAVANGSMVGGVRVASPDPEDRIIVGTEVPNIISGMTQRLAYRGFDLTVVANARFGHTIQSAFHGGGIFHSARGNHLVTDYWTEDNPNAEFPRPHAGLQQPHYMTTLRYFDGSFIKIRSINFGYQFGPGIIDRLGIRSLRLYVNIANPYVYSTYVRDYHGIDPETSMDPIPQAATIMGGWTIDF